MADYAARLKEILRSHGCRFDRQGKRDHGIWFSAISGRHFAVDGKIKSRHTANAVLKQAGIEKHF